MEFKGKRIYTEEPSTGDAYRQNYVDGMQSFLEKLNRAGADARKRFMPPEGFSERIEDYRRAYLEMLGIADMDVSAPEHYECEAVGEDDLCKIYRYVLHMKEGIPFYGLLFVPHERRTPAPLMICQHGGHGTPELAANMHGKNNYNCMIQRTLERGAVVFAPQLMLWRCNGESAAQRTHPIEYDRRRLDASLRRFGLSITGLEITFIRRAISLFSEMDWIDGERIGMTGISYGGYFTLHTMAAEPRIKVGYSNACFNNRDCYPAFTDWYYAGSGYRFQDAEVAALCAPRKLFLSVGTQDPLFDYQKAIPEAERAKVYYEAFGKPENLVFQVWEGGHTVSSTDEGFDFLFEVLDA